LRSNKLKGKVVLFFLTLFCLYSNKNFSNIIKASNIELSKVGEIDRNYLKQKNIEEYIIGPGDGLFIIVSRALPELNSYNEVDGEGNVYLPRLKRIFVNGLTIPELNKLLNESYKKYVKNPDVEAYINNYRPIRVMVDGEVNNPGLYTLSGSSSLRVDPKERIESFEFEVVNSRISDPLANLNKPKKLILNDYFPTIYDAIRTAGGVTTFSDLSAIEVIRVNSITNGGGYKKAIVNFENFINANSSFENIRIYDGDVINIKKSVNPEKKAVIAKAIKSNLNPKYINVYITGRVKKSGPVTIKKMSSMNEALLLAGGTKILKGPITFVRLNEDGTLRKQKLRFRQNAEIGSRNNPLLRDNDIIFVGDNLFTATSEIINDVTSPLKGVISTYALIQVLND